MTTVKNNQLRQEHDAWKRSLEFYKQENALLKYRLSEMVDEMEGYQFLQTAEYFQNEFLIKDEILKNLLLSLQTIVDGIPGETYARNGFTEKNYAEHDSFRNKISQFEQDFNQLSKEFHQKIIRSIG